MSSNHFNDSLKIYYKILGLEIDAGFKEIRKNYRKLAKIHHPDHTGNREFMKLLNQAYQTLIDPIKRNEYDTSIIRTDWAGELRKRLECSNDYCMINNFRNMYDGLLLNSKDIDFNMIMHEEFLKKIEKDLESIPDYKPVCLVCNIYLNYEVKSQNQHIMEMTTHYMEYLKNHEGLNINLEVKKIFPDLKFLNLSDLTPQQKCFFNNYNKKFIEDVAKIFTPKTMVVKNLENAMVKSLFFEPQLEGLSKIYIDLEEKIKNYDFSSTLLEYSDYSKYYKQISTFFRNSEIFKFACSDIYEDGFLSFFSSRRTEGDYYFGQKYKKFIPPQYSPKIWVKNVNFYNVCSSCQSCNYQPSFFSKGLTMCCSCGHRFCIKCIGKGKCLHMGYDYIVDLCSVCQKESLRVLCRAWLTIIKDNVSGNQCIPDFIALNILEIIKAHNCITEFEKINFLSSICNDLIKKQNNPKLAFNFFNIMNATVEEWNTFGIKILNNKNDGIFLYELERLFSKKISSDPGFISNFMKLKFDNQISTLEDGGITNEYRMITLRNFTLDQVLFAQDNKEKTEFYTVSQLFSEIDERNLEKLTYLLCLFKFIKKMNPKLHSMMIDRILKNKLNFSILFNTVLDFLLSKKSKANYLLELKKKKKNLKILIGIISNLPEIDRLSVLIQNYFRKQDRAALHNILLFSSLVADNFDFEKAGDKNLTNNLFKEAIFCYQNNDFLKNENQFIQRGLNQLRHGKTNLGFSLLIYSHKDWNELGNLLFEKRMYFESIIAFLSGIVPMEDIIIQSVMEKVNHLYSNGEKNWSLAFALLLLSKTDKPIFLFFDQLKEIMSKKLYLKIITRILKNLIKLKWKDLSILHKEFLLVNSELNIQFPFCITKGILHLIEEKDQKNSPAVRKIWFHAKLSTMSEKDKKIENKLREAFMNRDSLKCIEIFNSFPKESAIYGILLLKENLSYGQPLPSYWSFIYFFKALIAVHSFEWENFVKNLQLCQTFLIQCESELQKLALEASILTLLNHGECRKILEIFSDRYFASLGTFKMNESLFEKKTININYLEETENYIQNLLVSDLEKGFLYLQFYLSNGKSKALENSLVFFIIHMTNPNNSFSDIYATRSFILILIQNVFYSMIPNFLPLRQLQAFQFCKDLIFRSLQIVIESAKKKNYPINNDLDVKQLCFLLMGDMFAKKCLNSFKIMKKICPLPYHDNSSIMDQVIFEQTNSSILKNLLESNNKQIITDTHAKYFLLEGTFTGWIDNSISIEERRRISMEAFLQEKGFKIEEVEKLMNWKMFNRGDEGWLLPESKWLLLDPNNQFINISGVKVDSNSNDLTFFLSKSDHGLFDVSDIKEILRKGINYAEFTLDPPNHDIRFHPFQEMKYSPDALKDTNMLLTLLHADYILKIIAIGTEPSAKFPFSLRDATSVFERFPHKFVKKLKKMRSKSLGQNKTSRFWFEAKEFRYNKVQDNKTSTIYIEDCELEILSKAMRVNEKGELIDDDSIVNSPDQDLAKFLTFYISYLEEAFPVISRLKQLLKIAFISTIIRKFDPTTLSKHGFESSSVDLSPNRILKSEGECNFVPSCFASTDSKRIYGGVSLLPKPKLDNYYQRLARDFLPNGVNLNLNSNPWFSSNKEVLSSVKSSSSSPQPRRGDNLSHNDLNQDVERVYVMRRDLNIPLVPRTGVVAHSGILVKTKSGEFYSIDAISNNGKLEPRILHQGNEKSNNIYKKENILGVLPADLIKIEMYYMKVKESDGIEYIYKSQKKGTAPEGQLKIGDLAKNMDKYVGDGKYDLMGNNCHKFQERLRFNHGLAKEEDLTEINDEIKNKKGEKNENDANKSGCLIY